MENVAYLDQYNGPGTCGAQIGILGKLECKLDLGKLGCK